MALYNPFKVTPKNLQRFMCIDDGKGPSTLPTGVVELPYGYIAQLTDEDNNVYQQSESFDTPEEAGDYWQTETAIQIIDEILKMDDKSDDDDSFVDVCDFLLDLACGYILSSESNVVYGWNDD
jgi:hypothetical protein